MNSVLKIEESEVITNGDVVQSDLIGRSKQEFRRFMESIRSGGDEVKRVVEVPVVKYGHERRRMQAG